MANKVTKPHAKSASGAKPVLTTKTTSTRVSARTVGRMMGRTCFGRVVVEAAKPSAAEARVNIDAGRAALVRAKTALTRPGVQVHIDPKVPLYHADPANPGMLVRMLNGRTTRGRMVAGRFKPA